MATKEKEEFKLKKKKVTDTKKLSELRNKANQHWRRSL